jgi:hypothetical protein
MNVTAGNSPELKTFLKNIYKINTSKMPGALELIMESYNSSTKKEALQKCGLWMDQTHLINTMDFNFMDTLSHALS